MTLYDQLGVAATATVDEIKAAGRKAAKALHPDRGGDPAKFAETRKALAVLTDPERRERYDRTGQAEDIKNPEEIERAMAMDVLAQMMAQVMQGDARYTHLPNAVRAMIQQNMSGMKQQLAQAESQAEAATKKLGQYLKRLKKKDGEDAIRAILESQMASIPRDLAQRRAAVATGLRVNSKALELLADYEYEVDQAQRQTAGGWFVPSALYDTGNSN